VKSPPNRALDRSRRRDGEAFNRSALLALPYCRLASRYGGPPRRARTTRRPGMVTGTNPLFYRGIKVTSNSKLTDKWFHRLKRTGFWSESPPIPPLGLSMRQIRTAKANLGRDPKAPGILAESQRDATRWFAKVKKDYPPEVWAESGWGVTKPPANAVRSVKRRWFLLNNVVKYLPSSVRVGLVKLDVRSFYAIRRKFSKRGAKHVENRKFWFMVRSNSFEGGKWNWKRRRKR